MIVYFNGRMMPKTDVRISPEDRGFVFADGVYEVIRAYRGRPFRLDAHFRRLRRSLRELRIIVPDLDAIPPLPEILLRENGLLEGDAAIYLQITRGQAPRKHPFPDPAPPPTVYLSASPFSADPAEAEKGVGVILVPDNRWARCDIKTVALLPNVLAAEEARRRRVKEAVFVRDGAVTDGSHTNFCAVFDGCLVTPPRTNYILAGITREVVLELCRELSVPTEEFPIFDHQLREAQEAMLLGTTTEVMPVVACDGEPIGAGAPGPVTRKIQRAFRELTAGG